MPLSEFYRLAKGKLNSSSPQKGTLDSSFIRPHDETDFGELVYENGVLQGQSSRTTRADANSNSRLPSQDPRTNSGMDLNQGDYDDMVPWLNYPIQESLQNDYCPDFLPELSGVTTNHGKSSFPLLDKRSRTTQPVRNLNTYNSIHNGACEATRPSSSSEGQISSLQRDGFPFFRSRVSDKNSSQVSTFAGGTEQQTQDSLPANPKLLNFSHFSRPAALLKANLQSTISQKITLGLSSMEKIQGSEKGPSAANLADSRVADSFGNPRKENSSVFQSVMVKSKVNTRLMNESNAAELHKTLQHKEDVVNDDETAKKRVQDSGKASEQAAGGSSSVCSGNSVERALDDPTNNLKRKCRDAEDSECPSEDVEEESEGVKKSALARSAGSKRSRAAEVHNLSERRRRDRINEKMHALQELIPNCSKVDKASMLDEAIEYLKTLQLQVQIMSMGAGVYMPHMMLQPGMHYSSMGVGMGMGMSMGYGMPDMNGRSVPLMHGAQFPSPHMPMQGMAAAGSNLHPYGLPGQGLPFSMRHQSLFPGHIMNSPMGLNNGLGPINNLDSATATSCKDTPQNIDSQVLQNAGGSSSMKHTASQVSQSEFDQSTLVQDNVNDSEDTTIRPAKENEDIPRRPNLLVLNRLTACNEARIFLLRVSHISRYRNFKRNLGLPKSGRCGSVYTHPALEMNT
ncbi:hypothetical protein ACFE04_027032 [Oxalis oulophora]